MFKSGIEKTFSKKFGLPYETERLPYTIVHNYTPDFVVKSKKAYVECKGRFTGADRTKHLQIKKQHPEVAVLLAFQAPFRTLSKKSKTTYADWCTKVGIRWCDVTDTEAINNFIKDHS